MSDVAELGLAVDSGPVKDATGDLKEFSKASKDAAKSADELGKSAGDSSKGADAIQKSTDKAAASLKEAEARIKATANAYEKMRGAMSGGGGGAGGGGLASDAAGMSARGLAAMAALGVGITAAGAAIGYLVYQYSEAQQKIEQSLIGIGKRTGETVSGINRFSVEQSSAVGLSVDQARGVAIEFAKTGGVAASSLQGLGDAVYGFSVLTGKDATDSAKALAQALSGDLVKGAKELDKIYGDLDVSTLENIASLQTQGERAKAAQVIIDNLAASNRKAADSTDILTKSYNFLANALSAVKNMPAQLSKNPEALEFLSVTGSGGSSEPVAEAQRRVREETEKLDAATYAEKMKKIALANLEVVQSTFPQIEQLRKVQEELNKLEAARNSDAKLGETGSIYNDAALTALQNQKAAIQDSFATSLRYNEQVAQISISWGNVGQSVAMQLQSMQNGLPVAQAWTNATRMRAQEEATYLTLIQQGRTEEEASVVAAKQYELSKASAVANAQRLVQSSNDNLEKIRAQGTGMEGVVAASQAYRDAIQGGATAMQANVIAANTLEASLMRVAQQQQQIDQATAAYNQQLASASQVASPSTGGRKSSFNTNGKQYTLAGGDPTTNALLRMQAEEEALGVGGLVADKYSSGGLAAALNAAKGSPNTFGADPAMAAMFAKGGYDLNTILGKQQSVVGDKLSSVDSLLQLQNAKTNDKAVQRANIQAIMDWAQTLPQTIERDQKLIAWQQSIDALKSATDANTDALNSVKWNPLYTQGRSAIRVGYMGAANGFDGMVTGGIPGVDSVPINLMAQQGERVIVVPPGGSVPANNNGSSTVINQTNNFLNSGGRDDRMSELQIAQGFGRIASAERARRR